jgi:hypothetical protein
MDELAFKEGTTSHSYELLKAPLPILGRFTPVELPPHLGDPRTFSSRYVESQPRSSSKRDAGITQETDSTEIAALAVAPLLPPLKSITVNPLQPDALVPGPNHHKMSLIQVHSHLKLDCSPRMVANIPEGKAVVMKIPPHAKCMPCSQSRKLLEKSSGSTQTNSVERKWGFKAVHATPIVQFPILQKTSVKLFGETTMSSLVR